MSGLLKGVSQTLMSVRGQAECLPHTTIVYFE